MSDINFEAILAAHNEECRSAKEYNSWCPDDGEYTVLVTGCEKGVSTKGETPMLWWQHTLKILAGDDPAVIDREFTNSFFSSSYGTAKRQARVCGSIPEGVEIDANILDQALMGAAGVILKAEVKTTVSKKNGKEYTNTYYQEVIAAEAPVEQPAEPPQG